MLAININLILTKLDIQNILKLIFISYLITSKRNISTKALELFIIPE
jgi:hypothetical protein